ncbi:MAG: ribosomal RNA small subunit methyltransferase A [Chitinophagaceae bacterium]|nr:ribosomal RNA small subunit methyltransferase A [Chitinophagaceae bacterium]
MYTLKKSLGQHFLRDENISRKIVACVRETLPREGACLLEVGPGAGALTKYLIEIEGIDFKAVELDDEKVVYLLKTWPRLEGKIIHRSILDIDSPFEGKFTVVGNFPYNISSQILFKMLDWKTQLLSMTGMFQKEVAQRVAAGPGSKVYGVLSVLIQAFFSVEYLFEVHEQCFQPPPKVKSAVIQLLPLSEEPPFRDEKSFFLLVKTAFNQRRKTLRNAVKPLFGQTDLQDIIFDKRAEQLSIGDFARLTWKMKV